MNDKAESFKKYLAEKKVEAFTLEETKDALDTVVFRSRIDVDGNALPTIILLDRSIYPMIRVLVAPNVLREDNELRLLRLLNGYNRKYKSFKYYLDDSGALILDSCLPDKLKEVDGDLVYILLDVIIHHLQEEYKTIMKEIWK